MIRLDYTGEVMAMTDAGMRELRAFAESNIDVVAAAKQFKEYRDTRLEVNAELRNSDKPEYGFTGSSQVTRAEGDDATLIVPVKGLIQKDMSLAMMFMGGTSTQMLGAQLDRARADDSVKRVVLQIDSGGGEINGVRAVTDKVRQLAAEKTVVSVADGTMASAAYWIGSAAGKVYATPSSKLGSIGTLAILQNIKEAEGEAGIKTEIRRSLPLKGKPNPHEEFTEEGLAQVDKIVQAHHDHFVSDVTQNRPTLTQDKIEAMKGQIMISADAVDADLADDEITLEAALKALAQTEDAEERTQMATAIAGGVSAAFEGAADADEMAKLKATVEALKDNAEVQAQTAEATRIEAAVDAAIDDGKLPQGRREHWVARGQELGADTLASVLEEIPAGATVPQADATQIGRWQEGKEKAESGQAESGQAEVDPESAKVMKQLKVDTLTPSPTE